MPSQEENLFNGEGEIRGANSWSFQKVARKSKHKLANHLVEFLKKNQKPMKTKYKYLWTSECVWSTCILLMERVVYVDFILNPKDQYLCMRKSKTITKIYPYSFAVTQSAVCNNVLRLPSLIVLPMCVFEPYNNA